MAEILQPTLDPSLPAYQPRKDIKLSGNLNGACSDTMPALVRLWIETFSKYYPDVKIDVPPPYDSNLGARELVKGNIDFAIISRQLRPENIAEFNARFGYDPLGVPIAIGSYRHFGFLGQLGLTGEWAEKPIHIYGIKSWDGIEDLIRQRVLSYDGKRGEWRDDIRFDSVFPVARRVADDRYGIGYTGLSYIDAAVKLLPLGENANGPFYPPTYENIARTSYPLNRFIFFNTNKPPSKPLNPVLAEFLRFILSREGQQIVLDHAIFLPLRREQAKKSQARF